MKYISFIYGKYCLTCEPVQLPDGDFCCVAAITAVGQHRVLAQRPFPSGEHSPTEIDAVKAARQRAVNWIDQRTNETQSA